MGFRIKDKKLNNIALAANSSKSIFGNAATFSLTSYGFKGTTATGLSYYKCCTENANLCNNSWGTEKLAEAAFYTYQNKTPPFTLRSSTPIPKTDTFPNDNISIRSLCRTFGTYDTQSNGPTVARYIKSLTLIPDAATNRIKYTYTDSTDTTYSGDSLLNDSNMEIIATNIILELQAGGGRGGGSRYSGMSNACWSGAGGGSGAWARVAISLKHIEYKTITVTNTNSGTLTLKVGDYTICTAYRGANGTAPGDGAAGGNFVKGADLNGVQIMSSLNGVAGGDGRIGASYSKNGSSITLEKANNKTGPIAADTDIEQDPGWHISNQYAGGGGGASIYGSSIGYDSEAPNNKTDFTAEVPWGVGGIGTPCKWGLGTETKSEGSTYYIVKDDDNYMYYTIGAPFVKLYYTNYNVDDSLIYPCSYSNYGCNWTGTYEELVAHSSTHCDYCGAIMQDATKHGKNYYCSAHKVCFENLAEHNTNYHGPYKCTYTTCGRTFSSPDDLVEHVYQVHDNTEAGFCYKCGWLALNITDHNQDEHNGYDTLTCDLCGDDYDTWDELDMHIMHDHTCPFCSETDSNVDNHIEECHTCQHCGNRLDDPASCQCRDGDTCPHCGTYMSEWDEDQIRSHLEAINACGHCAGCPASGDPGAECVAK